jgi:hypothetical protein
MPVKCLHLLAWLVKLFQLNKFFNHLFFLVFLGSAMTQIGVGIGVTKSPIKLPLDKQILTKNLSNTSENILQRKPLNKQFSNNSSERRHTNDGGDDEDSNEFESHSDENTKNEKNISKFSHNNRRGLSVNWGNNSTTAINFTPTKAPHFRGQINHQKVKSFAHSLRNPIRLATLSPTKIKPPIISTKQSKTLTPIPSESELGLCRVYPPPQPRPESLAVMSDELFHKRLKARQSPLLLTADLSQQSPLLSTADDLSQQSPVIVDNHLSASTISDKTPTVDINQSNQTLTHEKEENLVDINLLPSSTSIPQIQLTVEEIVNNIDESSDESWRLLNSNSSLDIPYIDESDFEELGKLVF